MAEISFIKLPEVPLEMHKVRIVQKLSLLPLEERVKKNKESGNNAHWLKNEDVFIDMLTDSGVNAMSDRQLSAMMLADDAYAGSASYYKLEKIVCEIFGMKHFVPAHQGRACEHLLCEVLLKPGQYVPMNHHFTTARAHILKSKGKVEEFLYDEGWQAQSDLPFKGDVDVEKLRDFILKKGRDKIAFVRMEAGTNLIGGQPVSLESFRKVSKLCREFDIKYVLDASLLADNIYFNKTREKECQNMEIKEIISLICKQFDIIYFSGRKLACARGGGMCFLSEEDYLKFRDLTPLYEGFLTYGGMSIREVEAMAVGMEETLDFDMISQGPIFIAEMTRILTEQGVPMVTPAGGLGVHIDCTKFLPNVPPNQYPAGALHSALYLAAGIRGTERGTLSEDRDKNGNEVIAKMELLRLALPRRVFTLSQLHFAADRIIWLYENRDLIGGLQFTDEPKVLRFFFGKLEPIGDWQKKLVKKFRKDFGDSL